jgi:dolichol kinase
MSENANDLVPDKLTYQTNKRRMAWVLIFLMAITTIVTLLFPERLAEAESILMTQYISMCGLVGAYFGFSAIGNRK